MRYSKPALPYEKLAERLVSRGIIGDRDKITSYLRKTSYYRLSGYWYWFRQIDPSDGKRRIDAFRPGTTFDEVINRYTFDRDLRSVIFKAIAEIEVMARTSLSHEHAIRYGPFAYAEDPSSLPHAETDRYESFLTDIENEASRSSEEFVVHFFQKYGDEHRRLPVWMAAELMSFGSLLTWYRSSTPDVRRAVASEFRITHQVFESWLRALHAVRNICAHHGRLWNRVLGVKPMVPRDPKWHYPVEIRNDRVFSIIMICSYCIAETDIFEDWRSSINELFAEFPSVPKNAMGFPDNWSDSPVWRGET